MTCMTQGPRDSEKIANCSQIAFNNASVADGGYYSCVATVNISETNMASCYLQVIGELCLILVFIVWKGLCITFNHVLQNSFWLQSVSLLEEIILYLRWSINDYSSPPTISTSVYDWSLIHSGAPTCAKDAWDRAPYSWNMVNLFSLGCHAIDRDWPSVRTQDFVK